MPEERVSQKRRRPETISQAMDPGSTLDKIKKNKDKQFEIIKAETMKIMVFWNTAPCISIDGNQHFEQKSFCHHHSS
jgi:hypothetical protein